MDEDALRSLPIRCRSLHVQDCLPVDDGLHRPGGDATVIALRGDGG